MNARGVIRGVASRKGRGRLDRQERWIARDMKVRILPALILNMIFYTWSEQEIDYMLIKILKFLPIWPAD